MANNHQQHEPPGSSITAVRKKLDLYRDVPVNTQSTTDSDLKPLIWRLMHSGRNPVDNKYHWFCHDADPLVRDLAVFLLRLFAYTDSANEEVDAWRSRLQQVWVDCPACIQSMDEEKVNSRTT